MQLFDRLAVEVDRAGAARRRVAADVGAGQAGLLTDVVDEQRARLDVVCVRRSVDADGDFHRIPHVVRYVGHRPVHIMPHLAHRLQPMERRHGQVGDAGEVLDGEEDQEADDRETEDRVVPALRMVRPPEPPDAEGDRHDRQQADDQTR